VSEAVKVWAASHPEHYKKMGIRGALKVREMGLGGLPTKLEKAMENALKKNHIRYLPQYPFNIGIMDFYLPEAKIALFVDGTIWHADPRVYKAEDVLFFSRNTRDVVTSKLTAKEVWLKDRRQNAYLKKNGFIVMRFWEKEIKENLQKCIQAIRLKLSRIRK
jgi:DNA mismatch endonuclease, patch repair protein